MCGKRGEIQANRPDLCPDSLTSPGVRPAGRLAGPSWPASRPAGQLARRPTVQPEQKVEKEEEAGGAGEGSREHVEEKKEKEARPEAGRKKKEEEEEGEEEQSEEVEKEEEEEGTVHMSPSTNAGKKKIADCKNPSNAGLGAG